MKLDQTLFVDQWVRFLNAINVEVRAFAAEQIDEALVGVTWLAESNSDRKFGMLLIPSGTSILRWHERLQELGYSYSVVDAPSPSLVDEIQGIREMLLDWQVSSSLTPEFSR